MLSSLPCFFAFCWSAIPTSCYISMSFWSCLCHFFIPAGACWAGVCHLLQSSKSVLIGFLRYAAVLVAESLTMLCTNTESTMDDKDSPCLRAHIVNRISNSAILNNNCFIAKWFVRMCTNFENGVANEPLVVQWTVQTTSWDFKVVKMR